MLEGKDVPLESTPDWKTVVDAWRLVEAMAEKGESTQAERNMMEGKLAEGNAAALRLVAAGCITRAEAHMIEAEEDSQKTRVYDSPLIEPGMMVDCYAMEFVPAARLSLERLAARLPLLKQLVEAGVLHRSVIERVLPEAEEDLKRLGDAKLVKELTCEDRAQAEAVRKEAEACVKEIKDLLWKSAVDEAREPGGGDA